MRRVRWVACGPRLCWGVVVIDLVGVAVVLTHRGAGAGGGGGVLMPLVVPRSLALREPRPLCSLDLCGQQSLCGVRRAVLVKGRAALVPRWQWALGRVLLVVCFRALEVGWCDAAVPGSRLGYRALWGGRWRAPFPVFAFFAWQGSGAGGPPCLRRGLGRWGASAAAL